jgi:hypothetical protein
MVHSNHIPRTNIEVWKDNEGSIRIVYEEMLSSY